MYYRALALATSLFLCACSDAPAISIDCSQGTLATDGATIVCTGGDGDTNGVVSGADTTAPPVPPEDAGSDASDSCEDGPLTGLWFRTDGTKAKAPNFVAPSDGAEWLYPFPRIRMLAVTVLVSQHGPDEPATSANFSVIAYDNTTGEARPMTPDDDEPSELKHLLTARPPEFGPNDTLVAVLQAPNSAAGDDAGLWVWSTPTVVCY